MRGLSIITVHRNDFDGLLRTLQSVLNLRNNYKNCAFQWIVIDGASDSPSSVEDLELISATADVFISEEDSGIYDAMNKGIMFANEDVSIFMNAGDVFHDAFNPEELPSLDEFGTNTPSMYWLAAYEGEGASTLLKYARDPHMLWWGMPTHHQAMLFETSLLQRTGYDTSFRIASDFDLVCRLWKLNPTVFLSKMPGCIFDLTGISSKRFWAGLSEQHIIRKNQLSVGKVRNGLIFVLKSLARVFRVSFPSLYARTRYKDQ